MADLGAIDTPVPFDNGAADALIADCNAAAAAIEGQAGGRSAAVKTGSTDFAGHFSHVFAANAVVASGDSSELAERLREVATGAQKLKDEAAKEQQRRDTARKWKEDQDNRSLWDKGKDKLFGGDDPPVGPPAAPPTIPTVSVTARPREIPPPGGASSGGGGGTTSARPSNLRSFATTSKHLNGALAATPGKLKTDYDHFTATCHWGTLDASGVFDGYTKWLSANDDDVTWATAVANAFKAAGGEGHLSTLSNSSVAAALKSAHVSASRTDLTIAPPQAFGHPPTTGYANDPVNTSTGNFLEVETDLTFPGAAGSLSLNRCYNSFDSSDHAFGPGWASVCEAGLSFDAGADGLARLTLPDGRQVHFPRLGQGWDRAVGENLWLAADPAEPASGALVATGNDGSWWRLSATGLLRSFGVGPAESRGFVEVGHDDAGQVRRLTHARGQWIELDRDHGRVVAARSSDGRTVAYTYDEAGQLVAATGASGTRAYGWHEGLVTTITDADGVVEAENVFDDQRRVATQRSPFGRLTRFVYLPGRVTVVSDADGTRSNTWIADGKGRLVGVIDADEQRQSTSYDRWGNPVLVKERDGATTVNEYDPRGRRIEQVLPSGARVTCAYDGADRLVEQTVVSGDGVGSSTRGVESVTRFGYEGESRDPAELVDAEGGVTAMTWADGLLKQVVDPEGVTIRFDHDERGDLVATTDAEGNVARLERDRLGRVTAATTPLGHTTTYRYDGAGPLLSRRDPGGAIWRYEHTAGGRLSAVIDPVGSRIDIEHSLGAVGNGEETRTVDPLGRSVTSTYDDLGNRIGAELPDGSRWEFGYDALSRLIRTVDPAGGRSTLAYDERGFVTQAVDATGVIASTERNTFGQPTRTGDLQTQATTSYDALGRVVAEAGPDGTSSYLRYDRCGRLVEHTDPTGATTRYERDRAGRAVRITHPSGSTFGYDYDSCGRRLATIDTDGSRYAFEYDADGRLVGELWPTGERVRLRYDECGRLVERREPGQGISSWGYDKVGRLVRTTDGRHGRRRFRYDAAGQLVGVTGAAGGETRFDYDVLGQCVAVTDPLGGRSERRFDAVGRVVSESDPLGRTTRYSYDAAGRPTRQIDPSGAELSWRYDETGRLSQSLAGERVLSSVERDFIGRKVRVRELDVVHELAYDPNGQLVSHFTSAASAEGFGRGTGLSWTYDADGRRLSFTRADGAQTRYEYDAAGRVAALSEPGLGRAVLERDAIGRIVSMTAPGLHATWTWEGGAVARHAVTREGVTQTTEVERDEAGRVRAQIAGEIRTAYGYDESGQLVEARRSDGGLTTYDYDACGRMVREVVDGDATVFRYDAAGQLLSRRSDAGTTEFDYDAAGHRVREAGPDGERRFGWHPRGFLDQITTVTRVGDRVTARTQHLRVDALGELASVDGQAISWDTASSTPSLAQVGELSISSYGPLTALLPDSTGALGGADGRAALGRWLSPGWRPRATGSDPWGASSGATASGLPSGVQIGGQGNLLVDGLEWMQARVYDPASRGFLSTDPLDPVWGSGWSGNPYAFAGNDPLNQSDPLGLRPVTDAELQAYRDSNNGALSNAWHATTSWVSNNWEYIAAGAMIVGGVALCCTGIGGPAGVALMMGSGALISAGTSVAIQKHQTGSVDWGQVAKEGAMGAIPIPGAGAAGTFARVAGKTVAKEAIETGARTAAARTVETAAEDAGRTGARELESAVAKTGCFVAGTQVLMGDGSSKDIEDVIVGDEVTAADPDTGETHGRRVVETYVHADVETYVVETSAGRVTSTEEHPFYVQGRGWIPVRDLRPGDALVDAKGSDVEVVTVTATGQVATVHNFQVEELHTYHVDSGDAWIRVHNDCTTPLTREAKDALRSEARDIWQTTSGRRAVWDGLDVHHRVPLEWAHLTPGAPNRLANLVGMKAADHSVVTQEWNAWRRGLGGVEPSGAQVMKKALDLDKSYGHLMRFPR